MYTKELNSEDLVDSSNPKGREALLIPEDSDNTWYSLRNISFKKPDEEDCQRKLSVKFEEDNKDCLT